MTVIEKLLVTNVDIPEFLLSRLPIRDNSVVSSLIGSSGKVYGGRCKGGRKKATVDKIKSLLTDCGSPSQQLLLTLILKYNISILETEEVYSSKDV